jgi:hypothetical protein
MVGCALTYWIGCWRSGADPIDPMAGDPATRQRAKRPAHHDVKCPKFRTKVNTMNQKHSPPVVTSDTDHLHMQFGLPLIRRDLYRVLADSPEAMNFEAICDAMPTVHASLLRTLIDGLHIDGNVRLDRHARYTAVLPVVQA